MKESWGLLILEGLAALYDRYCKTPSGVEEPPVPWQKRLLVATFIPKMRFFKALVLDQLP